MRYSGRKGWQAHYKDAWSVDYTLNPIIYAVLVKFYEQKDKPMFGTPSSIYYTLFPDIGMGDTTPEQEEQAQKYWHECIEKMIYAFNPASEPDIANYDFKYTWEDADSPLRGMRVKTVTCTNEQERDRYAKDCKSYEEKAAEGRELFAKYYLNLWW